MIWGEEGGPEAPRTACLRVSPKLAHPEFGWPPNLFCLQIWFASKSDFPPYLDDNLIPEKRERPLR